MTKKDYVAIAEVLAAEYAMAQHRSVEMAVENITASLADVFARDNSRFNRTRFYTAVLGRDTVRP